MSTPQRLQKILASCGVASRRHSEELILAGRVTVNGQVIRELGAKADPAVDAIAVDGAALPSRGSPSYLALHKPTGFLTTRQDPRGRRTVMQLAPELPGLHPIGRLDYDTSGLLLLTNDGAFTLALTHPRYGVSKTYEAWVEGMPSERALARLREGIRLPDGITAPAEALLLGHTEGLWQVRLVLHEGRNRQVRRMLEAVGHPVVRLRRTAIGPITLEGLPPGAVRPLSPLEIAALQRLSGQEDPGREHA